MTVHIPFVTAVIVIAYFATGAVMASRIAISYTSVIVLLFLWPIFFVLCGVGLTINAWQHFQG